MASNRKVAFLFGENGPKSPSVLGGKGAGLAELVGLEIPVPPGFTVSTSVARAYAQHRRVPARLTHQLAWDMQALERATGRGLGNPDNPLLISVRSGAAVSMPGMMDTILNLGLNSQTVQGLARLTTDGFAWDCYRRFLAMYGEVVLGIPREWFAEVLDAIKAQHKVVEDQALDAQTLQDLCGRY
ncbi:MAG: pyruvate, phosphate dikinase, partial [Candidatus Melainabacteria bacterium]|nr:pyruvate, phosphate dikinase [Candidatus Melainabacteria bacterium]